MKTLLILVLLMLPSFGFAQESGEGRCFTREAVSQDIAKKAPDSYIYYRLYGIDIGFSGPVDVIVYTNDHEYVAAAFDKKCIFTYKVFSEEEIIKFIDSYTKKASWLDGWGQYS